MHVYSCILNLQLYPGMHVYSMYSCIQLYTKFSTRTFRYTKFSTAVVPRYLVLSDLVPVRTSTYLFNVANGVWLVPLQFYNGAVDIYNGAVDMCTHCTWVLVLIRLMRDDLIPGDRRPTCMSICRKRTSFFEKKKKTKISNLKNKTKKIPIFLCLFAGAAPGTHVLDQWKHPWQMLSQ